MAVGERSVPVVPVSDEQAVAAEQVTLSELVKRAHEALDDERKQLSTVLLATLERLPLIEQPERDRQVALVLELLDNQKLDGLVGDGGVTCRAAAIEAVLRVGYPWALQLEPDDMDFFRTQKRPFEKRAPLVKVGAALAGGSSLMTLAASLAHGPSFAVWLADRMRDPIDVATLAGLFLAIGGTAPLLAAPEASTPNKWGRWLMCGSSIALAAAAIADGLSSGLTYMHSIFLVPAIGAAIAGWWPRRK